MDWNHFGAESIASLCNQKIIKKYSKLKDDEKNYEIDPNFLNRKKTNILFISSNPDESDPLRQDKEYREIEEQLKLSKLRDLFNLESCFAAQTKDITAKLLDHEPQIVHFSVHGEPTGEILLEDVDGHSVYISIDWLKNLFKNLSVKINCVILNSCHSATQAQILKEVVPYVISMRSSISDDASIYFSIGFYQALGAGKTIPESFRLGVSQIEINGFNECEIPKLL